MKFAISSGSANCAVTNAGTRTMKDVAPVTWTVFECGKQNRSLFFIALAQRDINSYLYTLDGGFYERNV